MAHKALSFFAKTTGIKERRPGPVGTENIFQLRVSTDFFFNQDEPVIDVKIYVLNIPARETF